MNTHVIKCQYGMFTFFIYLHWSDLYLRCIGNLFYIKSMGSERVSMMLLFPRWKFVMSSIVVVIVFIHSSSASESRRDLGDFVCSQGMWKMWDMFGP